MKRVNWMALLAAMLVMGNTTAFASAVEQETTKKEKKAYHFGKFFDNWYIGAGVGAATFNGNHGEEGSYGSRIAPTFNLQLGKWISPVVGVRANFNWMKAKSFTWDQYNPNVDGIEKEGVYKTRFPFMSVMGEVVIDPLNLIAGYKPNRIYSILPYGGVGWVRAAGDLKKSNIGFSFGIDNRFRLCEEWSLNLDLRFNLFHEGMDGTAAIGKWDQDFTSGLLVGASYYFKKRGFDGCKISEAEMESVRQQLAAMNQENQALRDQLAAERNKPEKVREITKTEMMVSDMGVFFQIDKYNLTEKERVNLGFYAEMIKKAPGKKFIVTGYCDKQTGSVEYNEKLSQKRAETVYNTLVNEFGVDKDQLIMDHKGGVDYMFYDAAKLSRVTIVKMDDSSKSTTEEKVVEE